jgi:hypothetical protein
MMACRTTSATIGKPGFFVIAVLAAQVVAALPR